MEEFIHFLRLHDHWSVGVLDRPNPKSWQRKEIRSLLSQTNPRKGKLDVQFEDLPEDVPCIIFSKLELKEVVKSSILSSKWRNTWTICSKLRFDASKMYKHLTWRYYITKFIDHVNRVLKLQHGKVVETLEIKVDFGSILAVHLDNWVSFAAASCTKNLALELVPRYYWNRIDRYVFPFELLDGEATSRLQQIQLSFVSFKLPYQFSGFPKLKRLDLYSLRVTRTDLQDLLSSCSKLEWLSIAKCDLEDEVIVDRPLSHLLYLRVARCKMTKIELDAANLRTFIYNGTQLPAPTIQAQELKDADLVVTNFTTFEHALTVLPKMFARSSALLGKSSKFSQLKHLKLLLCHTPEDLDNILSLASFLRAAPLIEELEIHFSISGGGNADIGRLRNLPKCPYKHMRSICITGFNGIQGQAELLVHAVKNATALEVLTIDTGNKNAKRQETVGEHSVPHGRVQPLLAAARLLRPQAQLASSSTVCHQANASPSTSTTPVTLTDQVTTD
ncbi:hypothetical protein C2845_PM10G05680 [Panicum miliaceum]|uniref:F-box domain-containing protein n=1 Tax=Panicum miliaceum TaxID=4540 RepID=A0A3L6PHN7_PANMI|nr:hypothetical protein C2845_PM10G05680 [Panicum miliaceum]